MIEFFCRGVRLFSDFSTKKILQENEMDIFGVSVIAKTSFHVMICYVKIFGCR